MKCGREPGGGGSNAADPQLGCTAAGAIYKMFFVCLFVLYDAVNGSDLRKVREWLEVRGPVSCDNYQMAHYLQAVA